MEHRGRQNLKRGGDIKKADIDDPRFIIEYDGEPEYSLLPDIGDPQMLFLANNISKLKKQTELGSRIVEVHNAASLFTGSAGSGASNLRRYIIENDMLEAIIALPEKMFYNTPIDTYLWIITNKKDEQRRGTIQLVDTSTMWVGLRKNIGDKSREITSEVRKRIMDLYLSYDKADSQYSKVLRNEEFGYYQFDVNRPLRLAVSLDDEHMHNLQETIKNIALLNIVVSYKIANGDYCTNWDAFVEQIEHQAMLSHLRITKRDMIHIRKCLSLRDDNALPVHDDNGQVVADSALKDTVHIPMLYPDGVDGFMKNEISPFVNDAWIDVASKKIGYEVSFTRFFYAPERLRNITAILHDLQATSQESAKLLNDIILDVNENYKGNEVELKNSENQWLGEIPSHWNLVNLWQICHEKKILNKNGEENNVLSLSHGNVIRKRI